MIRLRHKVLIHAYQVLDQLMLAGTAAAIFFLRPEIRLEGRTPQIMHASYRLTDNLAVLMLALGWAGIFHYCIRYRSDRLVPFRVQVKDMIKATTLASFWLLIITAAFSVRSFNNVNILLFWSVVSVLGIAGRLLLRAVLISARRSGYNYRYLLVIGSNERARTTAAQLEGRSELGYKLVGFIAESQDADAGSPVDPDVPVLGKIGELQTILQQNKVDEILVCLPVDSRFSDIISIVQHARDLGIVVRILPAPGQSYILKNLHIEEFEGEAVVTLFRERMLLQLLFKRLVDIVASLTGLIILSPLLLVVALVIKTTSHGPVFFTQDRVGMNQRRFRLYKFRSMVVDAEAQKAKLAHLNELNGPAFKIANDPRITRIGRFLRKTSIDELPQLINVLQGEMSLVGPRPPLPDEVKKYEWLYRRRLSVKPGITCFWQVSGRSNTTFEQWMEMDHDYIDNWSLWLDLKILLKTFPAVIFGRGAS